MSEAVAEFKMVSPFTITVPELLLRDAQTEDEGYAVLKGSIHNHGIRSPLVVTPGITPNTYILSDGCQRLSIAKELALAEVPVRVEQMSTSDAFLTQVEMNAARVDVKLSQYSVFLIKYATAFPQCTQPELAEKLGQPVSWLKDRLKFTKLSGAVQSVVDAGEMSLSKAVMLSGMDKELQDTFIESASTLTQDAFANKVSETKKEIAKAKKEGRVAKLDVYIHTMASRPKAELISELQQPIILPALVANAATPIEAATLALRWVLKDDDESRATGEAKWKETQAANKEREERKKAEREAKKAEATAAATAAGTDSRG